MSEQSRRYLFEYRHKGEMWGIEIVATSRTDAEARLKALPFARYRGEIAATITVPGGAWLARVLEWWRRA